MALIVLACFHQETRQGVWRVCFGLGFVVRLSLKCQIFTDEKAPGHHLLLPNSHDQLDAIPQARNQVQVSILAGAQKILEANAGNMYALNLIAHTVANFVALAWFCYDFVTYPFGLFSSTIISQLNPDNTTVQNIGYGVRSYIYYYFSTANSSQTVINCFYLPGCLLGGLLMDRIGRKQTMTLGFFIWAIWGFILGGALGPIQSVFPLFIVMYGIFNALGEMGPGVSTFLCAAESFPTPLRGHFLGLAAAVGKAGASIGTEVFTPIQDSFGDVYKGQQAVFLIGSAFTIVGGIIAWWLIPDMQRELESEDVKFRAYLEENGYDAASLGMKYETH